LPKGENKMSNLKPVNSAEFKAGSSIMDGDTYNEIIVRLLDMDGQPVDLADKSVRWSASNGGSLVIPPRLASTYQNGEVGIRLQPMDSLGEGMVQLQFSVEWSSERFERFPADGNLFLHVSKSHESLQLNLGSENVAGEIIGNIMNRLSEQERSLEEKSKQLSEAIQETANAQSTHRQYEEIEPEFLRLSPDDTDAELLQRAIDLIDASYESRKYGKSIKLGRFYKIEKPIMIKGLQPHIIIRGAGGGLQLASESYMFDGEEDAGGLYFQNVKFVGNTFSHPFFNCSNLIQILFNGCHFQEVDTVLKSDSYIQSCRFLLCNFKDMMDYQIKALNVYDVIISDCLVEWGHGGLINLSESGRNNYCTTGLVIRGNVIEGITGQSPIKLTHNGRCTISGNYFEGNNFTDIDMSDAVLPHRGIAITDNIFGNFDLSKKSCCVKVGKLYSHQGYNFSGNSGSQLIFDFTGSNGRHIDLTGGVYLNNGKENYKGIEREYVSYSEMHPDEMTISKDADGMLTVINHPNYPTQPDEEIDDVNLPPEASDTYYYLEGDEFTNLTGGWVAGSSIADASHTKEKNSLMISATYEGKSSRGSWSTANAINMKNIKKVEVEWELIADSQDGAFAKLVVGSTKNGDIETNVIKSIEKEGRFNRVVTELDVSDVDTNCFIRLHAIESTAKQNNVILRVYQVRGWS
jgi:uncharacterized protein YjbI with pentapeptide repeats